MTTSMAATAKPALHPVPEQGAIVREQIDAVSIAIRKEQIAFVATLALVFVLGIYGALRSTAHGGHNHGSFEFDPAVTIPMTLVALLIPFGVWRGSDRERRAYDWTMPVAQGTHTIVRMLAGWMWLMIGLAAYLVFLIALEFTMVAIAGGSVTMDVPAWQWLVPFTATSIAYLLVSSAIIGSDHPWRWIGGVVAGYLIALLVFGPLIPELRPVGHSLEQVVNGYYGLSAAIFGDVGRRVESFGVLDVGARRWLGATLIWGVLAIAGISLAARRHSTS